MTGRGRLPGKRGNVKWVINTLNTTVSHPYENRCSLSVGSTVSEFGTPTNLIRSKVSVISKFVTTLVKS